MTRAEFQRLLEVAVAARRITAAQAAQLLTNFDNGSLRASTPTDVEAFIAALERTKTRRGGGGYTYDPVSRRYTTPIGPAPRPTRPTRAGSRQRSIAGRLVARAKLYAQAARGTYEAVRGRAAQLVGYTEERRVLAAAEHCARSAGTPGCPELAGRWAPIGTLPRIGAATCRSHCRCRFEYRRTP